MQDSTKGLLVERSIVVRTYDIDFANIVHNIVYFRWLEDLRSELLVDVLPIDEILATGISPILTHSEIDYRRPVRISDNVAGRMWVDDLSRTRWTLAAEIVVEEGICATARQSGYFANLRTLRAVRVPERLQERWRAARGDG
ncbi:MAG TPA: thioesterase family protein [Promineifilum sp.]|nr:thioesterase family protein [Promineifilum sp.]